MSLYKDEIIVTNSPKKEVMKNLLSDKVDLFIVVDRLFGSDDIITGRVAYKLNATPNDSDITRYNLKIQDTIFPIMPRPNAFSCIPTIKDYKREDDARKSQYFNLMGQTYNKLNSKLNII